MKIVVGCPIRNRAWIFPEWLEHVRIAFDVAGVTPTWVFNIGLNRAGQDDGTQRMATELFREENGMWTETYEPDHPVERTQWTGERYHHMVVYRNQLLSLVQAMTPDYFFSVDSDILLHPGALAVLLDSIDRRGFDAVGGKTYLSTGSKHITTYANHAPSGGLQRQDQMGTFPVQIIMAIKLMNPAAYQIPYAYDKFGEDIGWSDNARNAGLKLGWDGRLCSKHIMYPEQLDKVDRRVGW